MSFYSKQNVIQITELGLKGDKNALVDLLHLIAIQEINNKRHASYNTIHSLIEKYSESSPYALSSVSPNPDQFRNQYDINLSNVWLSEHIKTKVQKFIDFHSVGLVSKRNIRHLNKILLYGPPGSGKTTLGFYIAKELNMDICYVKISDIISSRLGETMKNISDLFRNSHEPIIFIDEFDAFAKKRTDNNDVGELKRIVNSIIQTLDFYAENKTVIVSTNLIESLDPAILRRFGFKIEVSNLSEEEIKSFFNFLLTQEKEIKINLDAKDIKFIIKLISLVNLQTIDSIKTFFDKTIITSLLEKKDLIAVDDFIDTLFADDYISHSNVKKLKNKDIRTLSLLARHLEVKKYPKTKISNLLGIHRNSYKNYVEKI